MKKILWIIILQLGALQAFSQSFIYEIRNCNGKCQTGAYWLTYGDVTASVTGRILFKNNIGIKYSPDSHINRDSLDNASVAFRNAIPGNFYKDGAPMIPVNTSPNESGSIWIEYVYVKEDGKGVIQPFAALKIVFEGNNTDRATGKPLIREIVMTSDPKKVKKYIAVIKRLKVVNKINTQEILEQSKNAPPPPPSRN